MKVGLFFDKHTGALVGYSDLGEVNNILSDYEKQLSSSHSMQTPMAKLMLVFMVRELSPDSNFRMCSFRLQARKMETYFLWYSRL